MNNDNFTTPPQSPRGPPKCPGAPIKNKIQRPENCECTKDSCCETCKKDFQPTRSLF